MSNITSGGYFDRINQWSTESVRHSSKQEEIKKTVLESEQPLSEMSPQQRRDGVNFLQNAAKTTGALSEKKYPESLMAKIFRFSEETKKVKDATAPKMEDNQEAAGVKKEYRKVFNEINSYVNEAKALVNFYGEGTHKVPVFKKRMSLVTGLAGAVAFNTVKIEKNESGDYKVSVQSHDGKKNYTVQYDPKEPQKALVDITEKTEENGEEKTTTTNLTRNGTKCTKSSGNIKESYDLHENGCILKEKSGPGSDDLEKIQVNKDGSTVKYNMMYKDDEGKGVYDKTETPNKFGQQGSEKIEGLDESENTESTEENNQNKTKYADKSSGAAIEHLKTSKPQGKFNAKDLQKLIIDATKDNDAHSTTTEYQDLKKFVEKNWKRLDKHAKQVWNVYENLVRTLKDQKIKGTPEDQYNKMKKDIADIVAKSPSDEIRVNHPADRVNHPADRVNPPEDQVNPPEDQVNPPEDNESTETNEDTPSQPKETEKPANQENEDNAPIRKEIDLGGLIAIRKLMQDNPNGKINGWQMEELIVEATKDRDNSAAGAEYNHLLNFVEKNWDRLDKKAIEKWNIYEDFVRTSRADEQTGITERAYKQMLEKMKEVDLKED